MMTTGAVADDDGVAAAAAEMRGYRYRHGDRPLEGYTIQRAAGRGAFGEVYYAISDSGREVALKVVQAYEQVELRGIGQCMNLKSPHLVSVFDVRQATDGQPVVIMEFVAGPSLRELLDESPAGFGTQKAAFFLREIGKGLTYLHDCGIVHRDLKPANIFYENGYVKIGDYGLSKAISASHRSAQTVTVGTLHYMAPEVGAGNYDRSVDIYALGALLFEMLTGQPPFYGHSPAEVLMKHMAAPVRVEGIEEPFATVVRKALAKDPAERYQSVQEMVEAVFGSEDVRNSVSCFSPASLTMVAGRVANRAAGLRPVRAAVPPSSRAFDVVGQGFDQVEGTGLAGRVGRRARRLQRAARRLRERAQRMVGHAGGGPPDPALGGEVLADPLAARHRWLLAAIAVVGVAVAAGAFTDRPAGPSSAWFTLLSVLGGTVGVRWASRWLLPNLRGEAAFVRHLAGGGLGAALMMGASAPVWGGWTSRAEVRHSGRALMSGMQVVHVGGLLGALCVSMLLMDWVARTWPTRGERVSFGHLFTAGLLGLILGGMFDAPVELVVAALVGTSLAVQVLTPWTPAGGAGTSAAGGAGSASGARNVDVAPVGPGAAAPAPALAPAPTPAAMPPAAGGRSLWSETPSGYARRSEYARRSASIAGAIVMAPIRVIFHVVAAALVAVTLMLAASVAFDVPGLMASGRLDPQMPRHLYEATGVENWPGLFRSIDGAALLVVGCAAFAMQMWVRRPRGGLHMLRGAVALGLLIMAPFWVAGSRVDWAVSPERITRGWELWDVVANRPGPSTAPRAGLVVAGMLLMFWPAGAKRKGNGSAAPTTTPVQ